MSDTYKKQQKWLEVMTAYDAYKQACGHADVAEHLRRRVRDQVYGKLSAGTATMEDIMQLPAMHENSLATEASLGIRLDHLLLEYNELP